jgi:hypothetical protein
VPNFDNRLASAHLDYPRRAWMQEAKARLLSARGDQTVMFDRPAPSHPDATDPDQPVFAGLVLRRVKSGTRYPLRVGVTTIGRSSSSDIVFREDWVSRKHCAVLVHTDGRCEVHDLASRNSTLVNRQPVSRSELRPGDELQVCGHRLVLVRADQDDSVIPADDETHVG